MFVFSIQEYGHQDYQNPMLLRRDSVFVTQIVVLIALAILITVISFLYSRYCSYPQYACSLKSNKSRQKLRRYAQLGGLVVLEKTTSRDNNTKSPINEGGGGGGGGGEGYSPIEMVEHRSNYIKGSSQEGQGLRRQGQESSWDPEMSFVSTSDTERNLAAVVKDAIEAVKEGGDEEMHQSTRKLSLTSRRSAFLDFLAKTEYHQTSLGAEQVGGEEEEEDTVIAPRHYSFVQGVEVLGKNTIVDRHGSIT